MLDEKEIREINDNIVFNEILLEKFEKNLDDFFKGTNEDYKIIYNRKSAIFKIVASFIVSFFLISGFIVTSIFEKSDTNMWKNYLVAGIISILIFLFVVFKSITSELVLRKGFIRMQDKIERTRQEIDSLKAQLELDKKEKESINIDKAN